MKKIERRRENKLRNSKIKVRVSKVSEKKRVTFTKKGNDSITMEQRE